MVDQRSLTDRMVIDCKKVTNVIVNFIQKKVKDEGKNGVVLGLSGGLDSSTVAFLAARAMGDPSKVHALYLPDRDSEGKFRNHAQEVAQKLGLTFKKIVITEEVEKQGTYKPLILKITNAFPFLNQLIVWTSNKIIYPLFFKELPFIVTLEKGGSAKNFLTRMIYKVIASAIEEGFNVRHRIRKRILEEYAQSHNLLLIGCANRSESFVGWFVKDGVDDLPIETILGLYKNQVRQLARYLGVPGEILGEAPSPDMLKVIGDEDIVGYSYDKVDKVAYVHEHDLDPQLAFDEGVIPEEFEEIKRIHTLSEWKRENPHEFPDVEKTPTTKKVRAGLT